MWIRACGYIKILQNMDKKLTETLTDTVVVTELICLPQTSHTIIQNINQEDFTAIFILLFRVIQSVVPQ